VNAKDSVADPAAYRAWRRTIGMGFNYYEIEGDVARVFLGRHSHTLVTLVDADLIPNLIAANMILSSTAGHKTYYVLAIGRMTFGERTMTPLHRIAINCHGGLVVDHINHDGLDNRRANLRACSPRINSLNRSPSAHPTIQQFERALHFRASKPFVLRELTKSWDGTTFSLTHLARKDSMGMLDCGRGNRPQPHRRG